jgi:hypothetical protein
MPINNILTIISFIAHIIVCTIHAWETSETAIFIHGTDNTSNIMNKENHLLLNKIISK